MPTKASTPRIDHRSAEATAYRRHYKTARWGRLREQQLSLHPLCAWCLELDDVTEATEVHHVIPHKGDMDVFWSGPFISTCKSCHSSIGQREDAGKVVVTTGLDGYPL